MEKHVSAFVECFLLCWARGDRAHRCVGVVRFLSAGALTGGPRRFLIGRRSAGCALVYRLALVNHKSDRSRV
eukprot:4042547-Prymnesium_polylepis.1